MFYRARKTRSEIDDYYDLSLEGRLKALPPVWRKLNKALTRTWKLRDVDASPVSDFAFLSYDLPSDEVTLKNLRLIVATFGFRALRLRSQNTRVTLEFEK